MSHAEAGLTEARAARYFGAARVILKQDSAETRYYEPLNYLLGMAAELALKAYLLRSGISRKKLKDPKVGHNLSALTEMAVAAGLKLDEEAAKPVLQMAQAHQDHFFRYTPDLAGGAAIVVHADPNVAIGAVGRLLDQASPDPTKLRTFISDPDAWDYAAVAFSPLSAKRLEELLADVAAWQKRFAATSSAKKDGG